MTAGKEGSRAEKRPKKGGIALKAGTERKSEEVAMVTVLSTCAGLAIARRRGPVDQCPSRGVTTVVVMAEAKVIVAKRGYGRSDGQRCGGDDARRANLPRHSDDRQSNLREEHD